MMDKKKIVVIGGGSFGLPSAKLLGKFSKYDVTLITPQKHIIDTKALHRLLVIRDISRHSKIIRDILPESIRIIEDRAVFFNDEKVTTASSGEFVYDALIISTGAQWSDPIDLSNSQGSLDMTGIKYFEEQYQRLTDSKDIVLIGGGIIACELAGEIADKFHSEIISGKKKVTIYHSGDEILDERYCKSLRSSVGSQLSELGVNVVTGQKLSKIGGRYVTLQNQEVEGDIFLRCTGGKPNVPQNSFENLTNAKGEIIIDASMRAQGIPKGNVFAIGDSNNIPLKTVIYAKTWINVLVNNVQACLEKNVIYQDIVWPKANELHPCGVSLGTKNGAGQIPTRFGTIYVPKFLIVHLKSKNLFAGKLDYLETL